MCNAPDQDQDKPHLPHSPYDRLGGEAGVRALVERFYDLMDKEMDASIIRQMHPGNLQQSRQQLFEFLSGFFGGPPIYLQTRGHPRLRMRHSSFKIDSDARDNWLACMNRALEEHVDDPILLMQLKTNFYRTADHLINVNHD